MCTVYAKPLEFHFNLFYIFNQTSQKLHWETEHISLSMTTAVLTDLAWLTLTENRN